MHSSLFTPLAQAVSNTLNPGPGVTHIGLEMYTHQVSSQHQLLQQLQRDAHDAVVSRVEGGLDGDDELGDDRQDLGSARLEHVLHALHRQEAVGFLGLTHAVEEDGQVVVVVQLLNVNLHRTKVGGHRGERLDELVYNRSQQD